MAFFIINIVNELNDCQTDFVFLTECQKEDIGERCEAIAREWSGGEAELEDEEIKVFINDDVRTYVGGWKQITMACHLELKDFLHTLPIPKKDYVPMRKEDYLRIE